MIKPYQLFIATLIAIFVIYVSFLGVDKTILLISDEYLFILAIIPLTVTLFILKKRMKEFGVKNFNFSENSKISLKSSILFFLVFQVVDYYMENGFIGMISQWFIYWVMGLLGFLIIEILNHYKVYKMILNKL